MHLESDTFVHVSKSFCYGLGYSKRDMEGQPRKKFILDQQQADADKFVGGMKSSKVQSRAIAYRCADGSTQWVSWDASSWNGIGYMFAVGRFIDVSDDTVR